MSRARQRADRIREEIEIATVLADYGYQVHAGYGGEEQFSCDLHGDGFDNKPSARVYPDSNSWYCFACDRTRDAIETVREKEGLDFWGALKSLEKRYGLGSMEYEDEEGDERRGPSTNISAVVEALIDPSSTFEDERKRTHRLLDGFTADHDIPLETVVRLWEAYDKVCYLAEKELIPEASAKEAIAKVRIRAMEKLK